MEIPTPGRVRRYRRRLRLRKRRLFRHAFEERRVFEVLATALGVAFGGWAWQAVLPAVYSGIGAFLATAAYAYWESCRAAPLQLYEAARQRARDRAAALRDAAPIREAERVLATGMCIAADLRRSNIERDERRMQAAHRRAMPWQRQELPELLKANPALKAAFDASTAQGGECVSDWQIVAMWLPSMYRDTERLQDALDALRGAHGGDRAGGADHA